MIEWLTIAKPLVETKWYIICVNIIVILKRIFDKKFNKILTCTLLKVLNWFTYCAKRIPNFMLSHLRI